MYIFIVIRVISVVFVLVDVDGSGSVNDDSVPALRRLYNTRHSNYGP